MTGSVLHLDVGTGAQWTEPTSGWAGPLAALAVLEAGEAGTRYANILTGGAYPLPRLGFGALLGQRRIKAVVGPPGPVPPVHDPAAVAALTDAYRAGLPGHPAG